MKQLAWAAIGAPALIGIALLVLRRLSRGYRQAAAVAGALVALGVIVLLWILAGTHGPLLDVGATLALDGVGLLLATVFSAIWLVVVVYSIDYMRASPDQDDFYGFLLIMLGAVVGLCLSRSLLAVYAFWEVIGICTWRLTAFYRRDVEVSIANRTLLITFAGSVLMLVGFGLLYTETGILSMSDLAGVALNPAAALLILAGIVTKSASLPLYVWLPDAHTAAPSPVSAVLSGVVAKVGLIAYVKVLIQSHVLLPGWWPALVGGLGVAGALVAGGCALRERDMKRVLAFSTVSQLGYIFIGFALATGFGLIAGLIYLVGHAVAKTGLFLSYGMVEHVTHKRDLRDLGGLARTMPVTAVAVALLMLSIIGVPPFLGFFGKFYVISAAVQWNMAIAIGAILAAVLTLLYMLRLYRVFVGAPIQETCGRESPLMAACVLFLAVASTGLGLLFPVMAGILKRGLGL